MTDVIHCPTTNGRFNRPIHVSPKRQGWVGSALEQQHHALSPLLQVLLLQVSLRILSGYQCCNKAPIRYHGYVSGMTEPSTLDGTMGTIFMRDPDRQSANWLLGPRCTSVLIGLAFLKTIVFIRITEEDEATFVLTRRILDERQ